MRIEGKTLSPLWTANLPGDKQSARLTGWRGSLRWWTEALIRGLGGYACDPSPKGDPCQFDAEAGLRDVCSACRLWGCTGWRGKVKLILTGALGERSPDLGRAGATFTLELVPRVPLEEVEEWLLHRVFDVLHQYASLGGKNPLKPEGPPSGAHLRGQLDLRHGDFGLLAVTGRDPAQGPNLSVAAAQQVLAGVVEGSEELTHRLERTTTEWPDFRGFFFAPGTHLDRWQINRVLGLDEGPRGFVLRWYENDPTRQFIRGRRAGGGRSGESKKLFSFSTPGAERLWGYTCSREMLQEVVQLLGGVGVKNIKTGQDVLHEF